MPGVRLHTFFVELSEGGDQMSWGSLIVIISVVLFVAPRTAKALDCVPLDPRQQVEERARSDIEGSAATLFRIGKFQGSYKSETEREVKNLYDKYPNADKLVIRDKLIYFSVLTSIVQKILIRKQSFKSS
jgi:hypothetical protein